MKRMSRGVVAAGLGLVLLGSGAAGASAFTGGDAPRLSRRSLSATVEGAWEEARELVGLDTTAAPGTIDDGAELLPQASISLDDALALAQNAASGELGEVDLEEYQGRLVFNVDVGDLDVKVDAADGAILGVESDD